MNILEQEDIIKGLPDQALMQEAQMPSGQVPQYLVVSEIQRRSDMRKRYKSGQEQMPQATVKEQVMQEGIMGAMPQMPPQMAMAPQMPQRMPQMPPPQMPPQGIQQAMPPQMMFGGGVVRMKEGGYLDQQLDLLGKKLGGLGGAIKGLESGGNQEGADGSTLRSEAGALGVMQLMPKTAALPGYNIPSIFNLARNAGIEVNEDQVTFDTVELDDGRIRKIPTAEATAEAARLLGNKKLNELMGLKYLDGMVNTFSGRAETPEDLVSLVGIAYNAGPEVAKAWDGNPERLNDETRRYIDRLGDDPDAVSFAGIAGGFASDEPEAGSPEAQAKVVEAIQRRRAETPPRGAEEQLLDMGLNPIQASNLELGIGPRGPVNPFGAPQPQIENVNVTAPSFPPIAPLNNAYSPSATVPNVLLPETPLPTDGREPIASQLAKRTVDRYTDYDPVAPVFSEEGIFGAQGGVDSGVATLPTNQEIADARAAYMGRTVMPPAGDVRVQATGSAEVQSEPKSSSSMFSSSAGDLLQQSLDEAAGRRQAIVDFATGKMRYTPESIAMLEAEQAGAITRAERTALSGAYPQKSIQEINANLGVPSMIPELTDYTTLPGMEAPNEPESYQGPFSLDYLRQKNAEEEGRRFAQEANDKRTKGQTKAPPSKSNPKGKPDLVTETIDTLAGTPGNDNSNPANNPAGGGAKAPPGLDFADLIADSRRQAMSNALIQLGAGIAGGDVSKGIAAAGQAATAGTQDARDLDMRRRLSEYEAGREDLRREAEDKQFDRRMSLEESKQDVLENQFGQRFDEQVRQFGLELRQKRDEQSALNLRARLNSVPDMINTIDTELMRLDGLGVDQNEPRYKDLINNRKTISATYTTYMNELNDYEQNIRGMSYRERGFSLEGESTAPPSYLMRN